MVLSKIHIKTLVAITGFTGVFVGSTLIYLQRKADVKFNEYPLVIRSKDLLMRNVKAVELIGPPIRFPGQVGFKIETDEETKLGIMKMQIPFFGNKLEGHLDVIALVNPLIHSWELHTLKAEITTISKQSETLPSRTFLLYQQKS